MLFLDLYLRYALCFDLLLVTLLLGLHEWLVQWFQTLYYNKEGLEDILNEMISSTISLGGFVITALAILVSMSDASEVKSRSERNFFFSAPAFGKLLKVFVSACFMYVALFLFFIVLRAVSSQITLLYLFYSVFLLVGISATTLMRCLYLIYRVIALK